MNSTFALELRSVSRQFGAIRALDQVNFQLRPGEIMALIGENGAGKSTAVRVLSGFDTGYDGDVLRNGEIVHFRSPADAERQGVAIAQQELSQVGTMSVAENIFLGNSVQPNWSTTSAMAKRASQFLALVGLEGVDPKGQISNLSVGERHLVEVARLLSRAPDVLILDEPTAALGQAESGRILDMVRRLSRESGKAIIYVSHRLDEIFAIADQVTVFRDGRSQPPVKTKDLTVHTLIERMLGRSLENMFPPRRAPSGNPVLRVDNLWADGLIAPASVSVRPGEILGLAGQLGSGAGAFLAAIAGVNQHRGGKVCIGDAVVTPATPYDAKRHGIAYCSSDRKFDGLFLGLPITTNLSAPALSSISRFGWILPQLERRRAREIARAMTIDDKRLSASARVLSGGNQQKVALGKWISIAPRVLLVDEPTRGVDVGARAEIYSRVRDLAQQGVAVIVASTDLQEIAHLPDTIATFYRGRLIDVFAAAGDQTARILKDITHPYDQSSGREIHAVYQ